MDDNIASFMTKGGFGKWLSRNVIGKYILPTYDFHIANSPYTAEEFFNAIKETGESRLLNWTWKKFKAPKIDWKKEFSSVRAE